MRKLFLYNVNGITIFVVGALVMFLATKVTEGGRLTLVLMGNALFIVSVLTLIFHEKLDTNAWGEKVNLFVRTLVYFTLLIFAAVVVVISMGS